MTYGRVILRPDPSRAQGGANPDINYDATLGYVGGATTQTWVITVPQRATRVYVTGSAGGGGGGNGGLTGTDFGGGGGGSGLACYRVPLLVRGGTRLQCNVGFGGQAGILNDGGPGFPTSISSIDELTLQGNVFMTEPVAATTSNMLVLLPGGGGQGAQPAAPGMGGYPACFRPAATAPGYAVSPIVGYQATYPSWRGVGFKWDFGSLGHYSCCGGSSGLPVGAPDPGYTQAGFYAQMFPDAAGVVADSLSPVCLPGTGIQFAGRSAGFWTGTDANGGSGGGHCLARGGWFGRARQTSLGLQARPPVGWGGGGGGGGGAQQGVAAGVDRIYGAYGGNGILILDFED